jgi:predicted  nucleic acid-binding Zn-ribbon protein
MREYQEDSQRKAFLEERRKKLVASLNHSMNGIVDIVKNFESSKNQSVEQVIQRLNELDHQRNNYYHELSKLMYQLRFARGKKRDMLFFRHLEKGYDESRYIEALEEESKLLDSIEKVEKELASCDREIQQGEKALHVLNNQMFLPENQTVVKVQQELTKLDNEINRLDSRIKHHNYRIRYFNNMEKLQSRG